MKNIKNLWVHTSDNPEWLKQGIISLTSVTSHFKPWTEIKGCPVTLRKEFIFSQPKTSMAKTQTEFVPKYN